MDILPWVNIPRILSIYIDPCQILIHCSEHWWLVKIKISTSNVGSEKCGSTEDEVHHSMKENNFKADFSDYINQEKMLIRTTSIGNRKIDSVQRE